MLAIPLIRYPSRGTYFCLPRRSPTLPRAQSGPGQGFVTTKVKELITGSTAIPVLVDGEEAVSDSSRIISYLEAKYTFGPVGSRLQREELSPTISNAVPFSFREAPERSRQALREAHHELLG